MVKRKNGFFKELCKESNIYVADLNARRSKKSSLKYILEHDEIRDIDNLYLLQ